MSNLTAMFDVTGWSFTAGPKHMTEITASVDCMEVTEHPLEAVAETLLCFPQITLMHAAEPSWQEWQAHWHDGENFLELNLQPFFGSVWHNINLQGHCTIGDALALWLHLISRHDGIWLCEQGEEDSYLHTPLSFIKRHMH